MRPSFLAHVISAIILSIAIILFIINYNKLNTINLIIITLLLSIAIAIHGISHMLQEIYFDYNPLIGKWIVNDYPLM